MNNSKTKATPRVSVIMRSKNVDWVIGEALAALFSQEFTDFELLVVDSGSTDRTLELVRQYPHCLIEIESADYLPGRVLNKAIETTNAEIIVFQNSDGVPLSRHTLGRLVAAFDDDQVQAAFARQVPRPDAHAWVRREYAESFPSKTPCPDWITLSLPMAAMRRSAWIAHPFYTVCWGSEDTEWGYWAKTNDVRVQYVPNAEIMHSHNYTMKQLYGRMFIEGEADAFIYGYSEGYLGAGLRCAIRAAKDLKACITYRHFGELFSILPRRIVHHWGYFQGNRLGVRRRSTVNSDSSVGQRVILESRDSRTNNSSKA